MGAGETGGVVAVGVRRPWSLLGGVALVAVSVTITASTYHPLPEGIGPVDGRGLFAPLLIVPLAAVGGVLVGRVVESNDSSVIETVTLTALMTAASVTPSVAYMIFLTGPSVISDPAVYTDWYTLGFAVAATFLFVRLAGRLVSW